MTDDEPRSMRFEDDEAKNLAETENKQGSDKRAPDSEQGESVPEGGSSSGDPQADTGVGGDAPSEGGGASQGGGSTGEGGGASQAGGSGN